MSISLSNITGVILAGGKSSRFGSNKAFAQVSGIPLIRNICSQLSGILRNIVVIANSPEDYSFIGLPVIQDRVPRKGPISGIYTSLETTCTPWIFVVPCDLPFFSYKLCIALAQYSKGADAVCFQHNNLIEPLPALLHIDVMNQARLLFERGDYSLNSLLNMSITTIMPIEHCMNSIDPKMLTNCNTIEDYRKLVPEDTDH